MLFDILFFLIAGGIVFALYKVIFQKKAPAKTAAKVFHYQELRIKIDRKMIQKKLERQFRKLKSNKMQDPEMLEM